jgi:hypothetical protein
MTLEIFGALREDALTASEKERMAFSKPITLCDETRMQTYEFPADVNCCRFVLPAHIDELVFTSLFDRHIKILQRYHAKCPVKAVHVDCLRPVSAATVSASVEEAGDGD